GRGNGANAGVASSVSCRAEQQWRARTSGACLKQNFDEVWDYYDVLGRNQVEIEQMASFYKKLLKDYTISIQ
ncbi:MAG: hypothetical protein ACKO96_48640, partial [Flammeovirgaceae bacterium]